MKKRKTVRKILTLCMAIAMTAGMAMTVFAAETIKINGYGAYTPNADSLITAEYQISISNVVKEDSTKYLEWADTYICQSPVTVTALDDLGDFGGATLIPQANLYIEGEKLDVKGNAKFYDGRVKAYNKDSEEFWDLDYEIQKGATITITEPGLYYVIGRYPAIDGGAMAVLVVQEGSDKTPAPAPVAVNATANPTSSKVIVNGSNVSFESYNINGNNYFKLRDVAAVLGTSDKRFEVTWDGTKKAINLISGKAYTAVGGELALGDGAAKKAVASTSTIYKDGAVVNLAAYTINGNNYFKLRDLGQAFDFGVAWDAQNNAVVIDTSVGYTAE